MVRINGRGVTPSSIEHILKPSTHISENMKDFVDMFSKEHLQIAKNKRLRELLTRDLNFELGILVGEDLLQDLPTLSSDWIHSKNVIQLSNEHSKEVATATNAYAVEQISFEELKTVRNEIAEKYLPKIHKYTRPALNITNMEEFKKGLTSSIWYCDYSWYSSKTEDLDVLYSDDYTYMIIELKLQIDC